MKAHCLPLLFCLVFAPVLAQTPDTTAAWRYLPLEVGNVWEYEEWQEVCDPFPHCDGVLRGYERWTVAQDSVNDGQAYFVLNVQTFNTQGVPGQAWQRLVRFDTLAARGLAWLEDGSEEGWPNFQLSCPLDAPFDTVIECGENSEPVFVETGGEIEVEVAGVSETRPIKFFQSATASSLFVSSLGLLGNSWGDVGYASTRLAYARVGDLEYGEPLRVSAEGDIAPEAAVALTLYPNPAHGAATVAFALGRPQRVRIEAFDLLGRRVLAEDLGALPAGEHARRLDLGALGAGVYLVRLDGAAGARATARIVRQ